MGLIGRQTELQDVVARLTAGHRLVSIVGPGGIGKTTLARAVMQRLSAGVGRDHVVELSRIDRADAVEGAIAAQLGFTSFDVILESHAELPDVLLVDNCEHVIDAAALAVAALLDVGVIGILTTSRSPLLLPEESILSLGPLTVPVPGTVIDAPTDAVLLFVERARDNGVVISDDELEDVAALVRRVDGHPLAIELAAARLRSHQLADILDRLTTGVGVLSRPEYRGAVRHRSVRQTIEWSIELLGEDARRAFNRLAVCAGPITPELAAAVVGSPLAWIDSVIDDVLDASLLQLDRDLSNTRFRMLEPIRAVGLERLGELGEVDSAIERMATHVYDATTQMLSKSLTQWDADLLPTLIARFDQIDLAIRHSLDHDDRPDRALVLYSVLWGVVHQLRVDEVLDLGDLVTTRWPDPSVSHGADAAATYAMSNFLCGHRDRAVELASAALPHADTLLVAPVCLRRVLAFAARIEGDHEQAEALLQDAASAAAAHGNATMELECLAYRAQDLMALRREDEALDLVREIAVESRALGSVLNEIWAGTVEAAILSVRAAHRSQKVGSLDTGDAYRLANEMLDASQRIAYPFGTMCNLQTLTVWHLNYGDLAEAALAADHLLAAVARSGAGDLRRALELVGAVLDAAGEDASDLAATAAQLPDTNPMVLGPLLPQPTATAGHVLDRRTALRTARRSLSTILTGDVEDVPAAHVIAASKPGNVRSSAAGDVGPCFVQSGDIWQVRYGTRSIHVQATKGMNDLAVLLRQPGSEVHCMDLAGAAVHEASTGEVIDAEARRRYEDRVRELQADIEDAEDRNDIGRAERARTELDAVVDHLTAALGLAGSARRAGGTSERARSAVTHRIRGAVRRIAKLHPELGRHLDSSLTTGTYCCYRPETDVAWRT